MSKNVRTYNVRIGIDSPAIRDVAYLLRVNFTQVRKAQNKCMLQLKHGHDFSFKLIYRLVKSHAPDNGHGKTEVKQRQEAQHLEKEDEQAISLRVQVTYQKGRGDDGRQHGKQREYLCNDCASKR